MERRERKEGTGKWRCRPSSVFAGGAAAPAEFLPDESSPLAELPAAAAAAEAEREVAHV